MALSQKKRFTFFGSPPMSPILSPTKTLSNYFSQEKQDDKLPNIDDVRKAVDNLERLVVAAEAYRDLVNKLSKASKTLSKTLKDYGNSKGMENVHVMCFQTTSQFYENHTEIQSKLNKALQKDFDSIQKFWDKYSKRMAKDEKAHNDYVGDLDKQLKKMSKDYEKKTKKENKTSLDSHNQYMTSITNIGSEIARSQKEYAEKVAKREKKTHSVISQIICKLAEGHFAYFNESLKKCGPSITKMKEWAPFAGEDMPRPQDLDSFLDDQESQLQSLHSDRSDKNSTSSERNPVSIASISSISEKQIAAMNFSQESKSQFNEESENIIPIKYAQMFEPKHPVVVIPEATKPTHVHPNSLVLDRINVLNMKNDENIYSSSPASSAPSSPILQPTPTIPVLDAKSLISKFSIGIRDDDNLFLRDEKIVEVHHPEVFIESKVEKNVMNQNISNQFKNQEKSDESQNVKNDIKENNDKRKDDEKKDDEKKDDDKKDDEKKVSKKKDSEKKDNERKDSEKKDSETSTKLQDEYQPEKKDAKRPPLRNGASDDSNGSNTTLSGDKKNNNSEKSNGELKIVGENETKKELYSSEKSNENDETIKLTSETINRPIKDKEKETTNERESLINKNNIKINTDNPLNKSLENTRSIPGGFSLKNKEMLSNNSSPPHSLLQVPRQVGYSRDDDYRYEYSREDTELYNNETEMNHREIIHRDDNLHYNNSSVLEERMRYNDTNLNYHRTQQYDDDDYESYDYTPSQNRGSYIARDRSPPRTSLSYSQRPYSNNIPMSSGRSSSVREITNRFQSMNEERRSISPSTRSIPMQTGRVSEMTSRFGERRNKRDEIISPLHMSNSRNGYDNDDDRYNEPIEYRGDRYIQYDDLHDGIVPVRYCNCHNCRMAVENQILMNSNRLPSRHNNPRTDSNLVRKNYR